MTPYSFSLWAPWITNTDIPIMHREIAFKISLKDNEKVNQKKHMC